MLLEVKLAKNKRIYKYHILYSCVIYKSHEKHPDIVILPDEKCKYDQINGWYSRTLKEPQTYMHKKSLFTK